MKTLIISLFLIFIIGCSNTFYDCEYEIVGATKCDDGKYDYKITSEKQYVIRYYNTSKKLKIGDKLKIIIIQTTNISQKNNKEGI